MDPAESGSLNSEPFPHVPDDLLEALEAIYPEVDPPNTDASLADLWRAIGTRQVIKFLQWQRKLQIDERLTKKD
jgi:hypothetical protein